MGGFRSDKFRAIYKEAVKQGFVPSHGKGSNHAYISCPICGHREAFTTTGRGFIHEVEQKISALTKHGFTWKGRGGSHTAPRRIPPQAAGSGRGIVR